MDTAENCGRGGERRYGAGAGGGGREEEAEGVGVLERRLLVHGGNVDVLHGERLFEVESRQLGEGVDDRRLRDRGKEGAR